MPQAEADRIKIPVLGTVRETFLIMFANVGLLLRSSWAWIILLSLALIALCWVAWPSHHAAALANDPPFQWMETAGTYVLSMIPGGAVAVSWHRAILVGDRESHWKRLRWGLVFRYLLTAFLLVLPFFVLLALLPAFSEALEWWTPGVVAAAVGIEFLGFCIWFFASTRLGPILPAIAIVRGDAGVGAMWRATAWNFWRLTWINMFVAILPLVLVYGAISWLPFRSGAEETFSDYVVSTLVTEIAGLVFGMLAVTALSLQFRHFFGAEPAIDA